MMFLLTHQINSSEKGSTELICITMTDLPVGGMADMTPPSPSLLLVSIIVTDIYWLCSTLMPRMTYFPDFV